jgi:glycosyltransferase involved in cell wall biosynthesis/SAM-dependent methyltransferase
MDRMSSNVALIIPALNPPGSLVQLVADLHSCFGLIVVINDGSDAVANTVFEQVSQWAAVLVTPRNEGKGAAIKTGLAYLLQQRRDITGVVLADADGQHSAHDIRRLTTAFAARPDEVVVGARHFQGVVPFRSRLGNGISRFLARWILGIELTDTQTGLRALPVRLFADIQKLPSDRYDFETEMLLLFKHGSVPIRELAIETIYEPGNPTSHFRPLQDSGRIFYLLVRFLLLSLATAAIDNAVFLLAPVWPLFFARLVAMCIQYPLARRAVFVSEEPHRLQLPRYILLVCVLTGAVALLLALGVDKLVAEAILFPLSFCLQRDYVFRSNRFQATDWTHYYKSVPWTAQLTRRYTNQRLLAALRLHPVPGRLVEFGGANSCFAASILEAFPAASYCAVDSNEYGLRLLQDRLNGNARVQTHAGTIQTLPSTMTADTVMSVGLIEHFTGEKLNEAVAAHFRILCPGGLAVISFPTPTILYSATRATAELFGLWKFPDERPLWAREVEALVKPYGQVIHSETLWPLILTQRLTVVRAHH